MAWDHTVKLSKSRRTQTNAFLRVSSSSDIMAPDSADHTRRWLMVISRYRELLRDQIPHHCVCRGRQRCGSLAI